MPRHISATEARVHLGEVLRNVAEEQETYIVERGGRPEAVVILIAEYQKLTNEDSFEDSFDKLWKAVERSQEGFRSFRERNPILSAADLIQAGRHERSKQIDDAQPGR